VVNRANAWTLYCGRALKIKNELITILWVFTNLSNLRGDVLSDLTHSVCVVKTTNQSGAVSQTNLKLKVFKHRRQKKKALCLIPEH